jgi:hypothetical protein
MTDMGAAAEAAVEVVAATMVADITEKIMRITKPSK